MVKLDAPAIGFRAFSWDGTKQLGATGVERVWPVTKEPQVASCAFGGNHKSPREACSCGLYARSTAPAWRSVCGVILGYGKLIIHPDGFRAEKAEIVAIFFGQKVYSTSPETVFDDLKATAEAYGARLVSGWDDALLLAKEQGGEEIPEALYQQAEENSTRPGWFKNGGKWEYRDHLFPDKEPQPVNMTGLPQFFVEHIEKASDFHNLLAEKRTEAKAMFKDSTVAEVTITIQFAT